MFPELFGLAIWRLQDDLIITYIYAQMDAVVEGIFSTMLTE